MEHTIRFNKNLLIALTSIAWLVVLTACRRSDIPVSIAVDGQIITRYTQAVTVREVLAEADITLGDLDRVAPDLYRSLSPGAVVRVIRVAEKTETATIDIPFERRVVINEALPAGEQRLAQLGVTGQEEIKTEIIYEDGVEVSRKEISRNITRQPVEEIVVVGDQKDLPTVYFEGSIAYLSGGNAWLMKNNSAARRLLTVTSDLDGHVFSLSPDGQKLLYSRSVTDTIDAPLNELWLANTLIVGEAPVSLPVKGVLYAAWSPLLTDTRIAYSTAERVPSRPGWRANNDLWLWDTEKDISTAEQIVLPNTNGYYAWWGTNYAWSPDGRQFAFSAANRIGVVNVISQTVTTLLEFEPYQTHSEWVWVPQISWSPNSRFIAATVHGGPLQNEAPEMSEVFDLWLISADGQLKVPVREQVGMWSNPVWHAAGITFGRAANPLRSVSSRYKLTTIDWDASNPRTIFPLDDTTPGVTYPEIVRQGATTVFVYNNNLQLLDGAGMFLQPLTANGQSQKPVWVIPQSITATARPNRTRPLTVAQPAIVSATITATTALTP